MSRLLSTSLIVLSLACTSKLSVDVKNKNADLKADVSEPINTNPTDSSSETMKPIPVVQNPTAPVVKTPEIPEVTIPVGPFLNIEKKVFPSIAGRAVVLELSLAANDDYDISELEVLIVDPSELVPVEGSKTINIVLKYAGGAYPGTSGTCGTALKKSESCLLATTIDLPGSGTYKNTLKVKFKIANAAKTETFAIDHVVKGGNFVLDFGTDGFSSVVPNTGSNVMRAAALGADGIIIGGYTKTSGFTNEHRTLVKWDLTGNLVPGFGVAGVALGAAVSAADRLEKVLVGSNGKIHGFGRYTGSDYNCRYSRYESTGSLDTSFSGGGMQNYSQGGINERCFFGAVFDDGRLFIGGYSSPYSPAGNTYFYGALSLNNGSLDSTFGTGGLIKNPLALSGHNYSLGSFHIANDEMSGTDDQVLMVGYHSNGTNNDMVLARINSNGGMDTTLGTAGVVSFDEGDNETGSGVIQDKNGNIFVVGYSGTGVSEDGFILKYTPAGLLDTTFGALGVFRSPIELADRFESILVQDDGKIVATGYITVGTTQNCRIVRLLPNGSLDSTFADAGIFNFDLNASQNDRCSHILPGADGTLYVAGYGILDGQALVSYYLFSIWK